MKKKIFKRVIIAIIITLGIAQVIFSYLGNKAYDNIRKYQPDLLKRISVGSETKDWEKFIIPEPAT